MLLVGACSQSLVDSPCSSGSAGVQLYYPFAVDVHMCDPLEDVKLKIPGFNIDDSFEVPNFEQYLVFQDTILLTTDATQDELNLGWLDYGARMYMADIGRWGGVDPLADWTC